MKIKACALSFVIIMTGLLGASEGHARQTPISYFGVGLGVASPGYAGGQASGAIALDMGRRLTPDFGVGAYIQGSSHPAALGASGVKLGLYGLEGNFYFTGDMDGLAIGIRAGLATLTPSAGTSSSVFSIGPKISFDQWVGEITSVGFEGSVLSQGEKNGIPGYSSINLLLLGKLWF